LDKFESKIDYKNKNKKIKLKNNAVTTLKIENLGIPLRGIT